VSFVGCNVDNPAPADVFGDHIGGVECFLGEGGDDLGRDPRCPGAHFDVLGFTLGRPHLLQGGGVVVVDRVGFGRNERAGEFGAHVAGQGTHGGDEFVGVVEAGIDQCSDQVTGVVDFDF
jgi:hypothetical protein